MGGFRQRVSFPLSDVVRWGSLSADTNPLHTDPNFASTTPFGVPIVQGHFVVCKMLDVLQTALGEDELLGKQVSTRFLAPVPVDAPVDIVWREAEATLELESAGCVAVRVVLS